MEAADIEKLKQKSEMDAMLDEVALNMPEVKEVLIDERDVWLGTKIFQASGKKVLAVIGAGHLNGTEKRIMALEKKEADASLDKIAAIPPKSIVGKILNIAFPAWSQRATDTKYRALAYLEWWTCRGWDTFGFR